MPSLRCEQRSGILKGLAAAWERPVPAQRRRCLSVTRKAEQVARGGGSSVKGEDGEHRGPEAGGGPGVLRSVGRLCAWIVSASGGLVAKEVAKTRFKGAGFCSVVSRFLFSFPQLY